MTSTEHVQRDAGMARGSRGSLDMMQIPEALQLCASKVVWIRMDDERLRGSGPRGRKNVEVWKGASGTFEYNVRNGSGGDFSRQGINQRRARQQGWNPTQSPQYGR